MIGRTISGAAPGAVPLARRAVPLARGAVPAPLRQVGLAVAGSVVGARTSDALVALTFDDGPDPVETPRLLDELERRGARGTFFVLAPRAEAHPELVREMRARGHEVGLHGDRHVPHGRLGPREVAATVRRGKRRLEGVLGAPVRLFRPPYGSQSTASYAVVRSLGLDVVFWTTMARDWLDIPVEEMVAHGLSGLEPGGVVLLHDRFEEHYERAFAAPTVDRAVLVGALLDAIGARGWQSVTVSQLLEGRTTRRALRFGTY